MLFSRKSLLLGLGCSAFAWTSFAQPLSVPNAFNAASPAYGAQLSFEASATAFKDRKASLSELVDGTSNTRFVVTGAPYRVRIALPFPVAVTSLALLQSSKVNETAPKDIEVAFDDGPPEHHTLAPTRPARNQPAWQEFPVNRTIQTVTLTVLSHHEGKVNWGGLGELALLTLDPLDKKFAIRGYEPDAPSFIHIAEPAHADESAAPPAPRVTLPPVTRPGEFPRLLFTPAEFAAFRDELNASERGRATLDTFLRIARGHAGRALAFPSAEDTAANQADAAHNDLVHRAQALAFAFALTGDTAFATPAREILLGYAEHYASYPRHSGRNKNDSAKVMFQRLSEAMWLIPLLQTHDYLRAGNALSAADLRLIETGLLRPALLEIRRRDPAAEVADRARKDPDWRTSVPSPSAQGKYPNWINFYSTATLMAGSLLDDRDLIDLAVADFRTAIATGIGDDGMWGEGAIGYQLFAMSVMAPGFEAAARQGVDLWNVLDGRFKRLFDTPLRYAYPDGTLPGINDSGRGRLGTWQSMVYDYGYLRYRDPAYAFVVNASPRQLHTSEGIYEPTRIYEPLPEPPSLPGGSTLFDSLGYAILRDRTKYSLLKYGPHGGVHGHFDRLNLILFGGSSPGARDELGGEPVFYPYTNPLHAEWTVHTVAHNTVTVDTRSQAAGEGRLLLYKDTPGLKVMRAQSVSSYPGVLLDRTVVVIPSAVIDLFHARSALPHTWDRTVRFNGPQDNFPPAPAAPASLGETDGYPHLQLASRQPAAADWSAVWATKAGRLSVLAPSVPGRELIQATGPEDVQANLLRFTGTTSADFPLIHTLAGWPDPIQSARWSASADTGVLEITHDDGARATVIVAHQPGPWKAAGWSSDARVLYTRRSTSGTELFIGGGTFAENDSVTLRHPVADIHLAHFPAPARFATTPTFSDDFTPGWESTQRAWKVATWMQNHTQMSPERCRTDGQGHLVQTVLPDGTPPRGGSLQTDREFGYGRWLARVKPSSVPGVLNSIFTKDWDDLTRPDSRAAGTMGEVDIEFLTHTFAPGRGEVHLAIHVRQNGKNKVVFERDVPLDFNPSDAFRDWGFDILPDGVTWHVDGRVIARWAATADAKIEPGYEFFFNSWTKPAWIKGPPKETATYLIDWVKFFPLAP